MINKIIAEYLQTNKRLVVPHFGAFIRKENSEAIVFVPFLKKDDGVLQQLLVSEYGMDSADAQAVIDEYIAEIKESIAARRAYVIEGVGRLMTDSNGICYLELGAAPAQAAAVRPADTASPVGPASFPAPSAEPARHTKIQQQARPTEKTDKLGAAAASPQSPARKPEAQYPPDTRPSNPVTSRSVQDALYGNPRPTPMQAPADRQEQTFRTPMPNVRPGIQPPRPPMPPQGRPAGTGYRPSRPVGRQAPKSKADGFIVIAILAAVAALAAIIFGLTVTHGGPDILPLIESSSPDTTQVQPIAE